MHCGVTLYLAQVVGAKPGDAILCTFLDQVLMASTTLRVSFDVEEGSGLPT